MPNTFFIAGPTGQLEAAITEPAAAPMAMAIICHPHPLQEGAMTNKVVTTLAKAYEFCNAITIRFNFRGVGASDGVFDYVKGECDDLRAVMQWARAQYPGLPIWLAGFSFGSYVAARVAYEDDAVQALVSIAPPVGKDDYYDFAGLSTMQRPWLVVQGDQDEIVSFSEVMAWWQARQLAPHQELTVMHEAGHFFHRRLIELRTIVSEWVSAL